MHKRNGQTVLQGKVSCSTDWGLEVFCQFWEHSRVGSKYNILQRSKEHPSKDRNLVFFESSLQREIIGCVLYYSRLYRDLNFMQIAAFWYQLKRGMFGLISF